jgi:hypothetical protein
MARAVALILAVTVAASGSGLPMCVSLLARAAEPCAMHQHQRGGHDAHGAQVTPAHDMDDACHSGDGDIGCATGGSCPTGGTAGPLVAEAVLATFGPAPAVTPAIEQAYLSFLSPPLSPPPQV